METRPRWESRGRSDARAADPRGRAGSPWPVPVCGYKHVPVPRGRCPPHRAGPGLCSPSLRLRGTDTGTGTGGLGLPGLARAARVPRRKESWPLGALRQQRGEGAGAGLPRSRVQCRAAAASLGASTGPPGREGHDPRCPRLEPAAGRAGERRRFCTERERQRGPSASNGQREQPGHSDGFFFNFSGKHPPESPRRLCPALPQSPGVGREPP